MRLFSFGTRVTLLDISRAVMKNKVKTTSNLNDTSSKPIDIYDSKYYSINKWLLRIFGQWPYQRPMEKKIRACILLLFSFSTLWPQTQAMVHSWDRLDSFSECFPPLGTHICCLVKLLNFMLQQEKLKTILDDTRRNWKCTQHPAQINILKEYGMRGRIWSLMWLAVVYTIAAFWLFLCMLPKILDAIKPLNESRETFDVVQTDYGFDQNEYWWWIQLHVWSGIFILLGGMSSIDVFYMAFAQQICAMFEISRYNLENIIKEDEDVDVVLKPEFHKDPYYHEVVSCIRKHKFIIDYVKNIASTNESCLLFIVGLNMVGLSVSGYQVIAHGNQPDDALRFAMFTFAVLVHLFVITLPGQWIMDSSSFYPYSVYNCRWYMMSLRTRRLIILILTASMEPCVITAGKIYTMSIENFGSVLKMSASYLSMLTSTQ